MMGAGSESLANKDGKLEETLEITPGSATLFRNDGEECTASFRRCNMRELDKEKGGVRGNRELHNSQINLITGKIFFYRCYV